MKNLNGYPPVNRLFKGNNSPDKIIKRFEELQKSRQHLKMSRPKSAPTRAKMQKQHESTGGLEKTLDYPLFRGINSIQQSRDFKGKTEEDEEFNEEEELMYQNEEDEDSVIFIHSVQREKLELQIS
jgi:hypothetical protein